VSTGAYSPSKASAWPDRIQDLREGRQPYPVHVQIILSDLCDLDCPQCAYRLSGYTSNQLFSVQRQDGSFNHNPNRMLDRDLVKQIIDDCVAMGVKAIQFTGGGEPTIHPQARELIAYAQDKGLDTALVTNGLHLDRMREVLPRLSWLRVSVDAATPETYAKVRPSFGGKVERSKQNWEKLLAQMDRATTHLREADSACVVGAGFVVQEENWREQAEFVKLFRDLGVDNVRISGAFTPSGEAYHATYREEALAVEREAAALARGGFAVHARFSEKLDDLAARPDYKDCWYQQFTTYVGGDGNLYRCCVQSYNRHGLIGNVKEAGGLKALWDSETKRQKFRSFDARSCSVCQLNDRNRAINAAIKSDATPSLDEVIHKSFV
jgi:MoaA/NifB/PqqE/SkfB family radical SAM enzyme